MAGLITDLIELLGTQAECYESLLTLAEKKSDALVKNDLERISGIVADEQPIVSKVQRLEKKRTVLMSDIALVLNKRVNELTVASLLEVLSKQPNDYEALKRVASRLKENIEKVRIVNDKNSLLIKQSMDFLDYIMNYVQSSTVAQPPTYPSNIPGQYVGRSLFDTKQ